MRFLLLFALSALLGACGKPAPKEEAAKPDNAMTQYADHLAHSLEKAQDTADKASERIDDQNRAYEETRHP